MPVIKIYDTTLRDGSQAEDITFTVEDKIRIAHKLDENGFNYIEGGWPGSNPKDVDFFEKVKHLKFEQAKIVAFGSTRSPRKRADQDPNLNQLLKAGTEVITIFGKSWDMHVKEALETDLDENLRMVAESIQYLKKNTDEVMFDAEHFFDGYKHNPEYALKVLKAAENAGADWIVLCDTNGGSMPWEVHSIFETVAAELKGKLGIHTHNDSELGVANALAAVKAGARQVQGTVNGIGERCGNCNLISVVPNLKLKMGMDCLDARQMKKLKELSAFVDELANRSHWNHQPYVGKSAFAHKGGVHVSAIRKNRETYEHIDPELVGNQTRILVSDLSGKSNIVFKAQEFGLDIDSADPKVQELLEELKRAERLGFQYEGAEGSFELIMREALGQREEHFEFVGFRVIVEKRKEDEAPIAEATVKVKVNGVQEVTAAEGDGPVNALDKALRKALTRFYPELEEMSLYDYKVRIVDESKGTSAKIRVLLESGDHNAKWGTVGVSEDIIEASWQALIDAIIYKLGVAPRHAKEKAESKTQPKLERRGSRFHLKI
ncbi:citramalate synthase [Nitrospina sp. 32_T5]|uniref:citramalate synthase n=1 Tax=unclassified Nitrospina TaxID=2638683 RepID=UPI003F9EA891